MIVVPEGADTLMTLLDDHMKGPGGIEWEGGAGRGEHMIIIEWIPASSAPRFALNPSLIYYRDLNIDQCWGMNLNSIYLPPF